MPETSDKAEAFSDRFAAALSHAGISTGKDTIEAAAQTAIWIEEGLATLAKIYGPDRDDPDGAQQ